MIDFTPIIFLLLLAALLSMLWAWWLKRWWFASDRVKRRVFNRVAYVVAHRVLLDTFEFGRRRLARDELGMLEERVTTVRFIGPAHECVRFGPVQPDSRYVVKIWDGGRLQPMAVWRVTLELDLIRLPMSVEAIMAKAESVEIQTKAMTEAKDVEVSRIWLKDKKTQRVIIAVKFEERRKSALPDRVDFEEMLPAMHDHLTRLQHTNRVRQMRQETLTKRLLAYGLEQCGGQFPLKKIQAAFADELSHRQIEALGQELEQIGILEPTSGPKPRKINLERARALIEEQASQLTLDSSPLQIEGQQPG